MEEANISGRHLTGLNVLAGWDLHRRRFTKPFSQTVEIWKNIDDEKAAVNLRCRPNLWDNGIIAHFTRYL